MDKNDKTKDEKPATAEAQKDAETQNVSASAKFSASVIARETLLKEIDELKRKLEESENKYKRALADYQNLEKRMAGERKEWILKSNRELLLHLLPVLDTITLAASHSKDEGLALSVQQFLDTLREEGVERIKTIGCDFDPRLMECIDTVEADEKQEEGKVLKEFRAGFTLFKEIVLRVAQVGVGKKKKELEAEEKAKEQLQKGDYM